MQNSESLKLKRDNSISYKKTEAEKKKKIVRVSSIDFTNESKNQKPLISISGNLNKLLEKIKLKNLNKKSSNLIYDSEEDDKVTINQVYNNKISPYYNNQKNFHSCLEISNVRNNKIAIDSQPYTSKTKNFSNNYDDLIDILGNTISKNSIHSATTSSNSIVVLKSNKNYEKKHSDSLTPNKSCSKFNLENSSDIQEIKFSSFKTKKNPDIFIDERISNSKKIKTVIVNKSELNQHKTQEIKLKNESDEDIIRICLEDDSKNFESKKNYNDFNKLNSFNESIKKDHENKSINSKFNFLFL